MGTVAICFMDKGQIMHIFVTSVKNQGQSPDFLPYQQHSSSMNTDVPYLFYHDFLNLVFPLKAPKVSLFVKRVAIKKIT